MPRNKSFQLIFEHSPIATWVEDLSAAARLRDQLKKNKVNNLRKFLAARPALILKTFRSFKVLDVNRAALKLYEAKTKRELIADRRKKPAKAMEKVVLNGLVALLEGEKIYEVEIRSKSFKGRPFDAVLRVAVPDGYEKDFSRVIVTLQDITKQKTLERHLKQMARLDSLTKLLNQRAILGSLEDEFLRARRYGLTFSCMMIDMDKFKMVNDHFGHQHGDSVLRQSAAVIKKCLRRVDIIGRYGGDEFLVILPETKPKDARIAAARIQQAFASRGFRLPGKILLDNTLSIGIAGYPDHLVRDFKALVVKADRAMYIAKKQGGGRIVVI